MNFEVGNELNEKTKVSVKNSPCRISVKKLIK
ncbi:Uncharacterised protein [Clostridium perfringens]|uniref:Uncharacterized protein n=1 Tax=Clostridium perfringens TaxID=1502 RepID=A0A2X3IMU4_CLOPF|nr:Uncharacterised protein [Clostridium perfringens]